jgi:hypothetical protein
MKSRLRKPIHSLELLLTAGLGFACSGKSTGGTDTSLEADTDADSDTDTDTDADTDTDTDADSEVPRDGLLLWVEAADLTVGEGAAVASWPDRSGNGNDLIQTESFWQPTWSATGVGTSAGVAVDGAGAHLTTTSPLPLSGDHGFTVYMVATIPTQGNFNQIYWVFADLAVSAAGASLEQANDGLYFATGWGENASPSSGAYAGYFDTPQVVGVLKEPGSIADTTSLRYSGALQAVTGSTLTPDFSPIAFSLGSWYGSQPAQATYAELLVYDHALSESDRIWLECHLADKHGIALDPSAGCP